MCGVTEVAYVGNKYNALPWKDNKLVVFICFHAFSAVRFQYFSRLAGCPQSRVETDELSSCVALL